MPIPIQTMPAAPMPNPNPTAVNGQAAELPEYMLVDRRSKCAIALSGFETSITTRKNNWTKAGRNLGSAYVTAWNNYTSVLDEQAKYDAEMVQMAFIVLGMVTAGGLSLLSGSIQNKLETLPKWNKSQTYGLLAEGLEDTVQTGVGNALGFVAGSVEEPPPAPIPHPQIFENEVLNNLDDAHSAVLDYIQQTRTLVEEAELELFQLLDEIQFKQSLDEYLRNLDTKFKSDLIIDQTALSDEIETGIWAKWCATKLSRQHCVGGTLFCRTEYRDLPLAGPILERFERKRILSKKQRVQVGFLRDPNAKEKLVRWGRAWQPSRRFGGSF